MPGSSDESVQAEGGFGLLDLRAVRLFNTHVQSRKHKANGCADCTEGLERVIQKIEGDVAGGGALAEGDGTDEGGDPAPPPITRDTKKAGDELLPKAKWPPAKGL